MTPVRVMMLFEQPINKYAMSRDHTHTHTHTRHVTVKLMSTL